MSAPIFIIRAGLEQHVERYRNSPVMHKSVPDECLSRGVEHVRCGIKGWSRVRFRVDALIPALA